MSAKVFFTETLNISLSGSIIVILICMANPITKKYFTANWHYKANIISLLFFLFPIRYIMDKFGTTTPLYISDNFPTEIIFANFGNIDNQYLTYHGSKDRFSKNISVVQIIFWIWFTIVLVLAFRKMIIYYRFKKSIKSHQKIVQTPIQSDYNAAKRICGIDKNLPIYISNILHSPALIGIINPKIYLPDTPFNSDELQMIFLHELFHYKRKDLVVKLCGEVLCMVHWYNPIIYILKNNIDIWLEYSIDEKISKNKDISMRKKYGLLILKTSQNQAPAPYCTSLSSGGNNLKRRISFMISNKNVGLKIKFLSTVLMIALVLTTLTLTACTTKNSTTDYQYQSQIHIPDNITKPEFVWPLQDTFGQITCGYDGYEGHRSIDIQSGLSDCPIIAVASGMVEEVGYAPDDLGNYVIIDHGNDFSTLYAHLDHIIVSEGESVVQRQVIGAEGASGNTTEIHLHYEMRYNDQPVHPSNFYDDFKIV